MICILCGASSRLRDILNEGNGHFVTVCYPCIGPIDNVEKRMVHEENLAAFFQELDL